MPFISTKTIPVLSGDILINLISLASIDSLYAMHRDTSLVMDQLAYTTNLGERSIPLRKVSHLMVSFCKTNSLNAMKTRVF